MAIRDIIQGYFDALEQKGAWDAFLADDMLFTRFTAPIKRVTGKREYLEATKRFYSLIKALEIKTFGRPDAVRLRFVYPLAYLLRSNL